MYVFISDDKKIVQRFMSDEKFSLNDTRVAYIATRRDSDRESHDDR